MKDGNKMTFSTLFNTIYLGSSAGASALNGRERRCTPCKFVWRSHSAAFIGLENVHM